MLIIVTNAAKLVIAIGLLYLIYLLREVVKTIRAGEPFSAKSSRLIHRFGFVTLAMGIVVPLVEFIATSVVLNRLAPTMPELYPGSTFDSKVILATLFILLLAQVWSYGLELEHDRALTA
jgi:hypothetical protein